MWILASASPRRKQLLTKAGAHFTVITPEYRERNQSEHDPAALVQEQALGKARAGEAISHMPQLAVLGADTLVVCGDQVFGKPRDRERAKTMLTALGGRTHYVVTGLALLLPSGEAITRSVTTEVKMEPWPQALLETYLAGTEWTDKAGAYAIQGTAALMISAIAGSYTNVVGLPLHATYRLLTENGVEW